VNFLFKADLRGNFRALFRRTPFNKKHAQDDAMRSRGISVILRRGWGTILRGFVTARRRMPMASDILLAPFDSGL
jgi:hypothetical protein